MIERIQQGTGHTIRATLYSEATPTDPSPDSATVRVVRADGTTVVATAAATNAGTGIFSYPLTPSHTAQLDTLTAYWTMTVGGNAEVRTTTHEVVGGFLFTLAEARAIRPLDNTTTYTTAALIGMRTTVEQALEDACAVAFVPRYALETLPADNPLIVSNPRVRTVRSATDNTTPLTQDQIDDLVVTGRTIYGLPWVPWDYRTWSGARVNVTVGYEHGYAVPPERVRRAALLLARSWLVAGPVDDRASTFNAGADGGTYSLVTPGRGGSVFGLPEVDVVVQEYGYRVSAP